MFRFLMIGFMAAILNTSAMAVEDCMGENDLQHCRSLVERKLERCMESSASEKCHEIAEKAITACQKSCPDNGQYYRACLGMDSLEACHKLVAKEFQNCSTTVTYSGSISNDDALNKCKEYAKRKKEVCKKSCEKPGAQAIGQALR